MSKPVVFFFVKTFSEQSFCDQFLDGALYMNSLDYFVNLEQSDDKGRGDHHEGIEAWLQPNETQIQFNGIAATCLRSLKTSHYTHLFRQ